MVLHSVLNQAVLSDATSQLLTISSNYLEFNMGTYSETQDQTREVFSAKWESTKHGSDDFEKSLSRQKDWYLKLYGFDTEGELSNYLKKCPLILDAGAGKGGKAAWFAKLAPNSLVVAVDISNSLVEASNYYSGIENLVFIRADISSMPFLKDSVFDYVSCDQVIHHTVNPPETFRELVRLASPNRELSVYVYRKKAIPRELVDDFFRDFSQKFSTNQLMKFSGQVTVLGRILSSYKELKEFPDLPLLGIEGGKMTLQRYIYWNFFKCFWNEELGSHTSQMTNFDWYAPSLAFRYSREEFLSWVNEYKLKEEFFHEQDACYSGRFRKVQIQS